MAGLPWTSLIWAAPHIVGWHLGAGAVRAAAADRGYGPVMSTRRNLIVRALLLVAVGAGLAGCRITTVLDGWGGRPIVLTEEVERLPSGGFVVSGCRRDSTWFGSAVLVVAPNGTKTRLEDCRSDASIATDAASRIYVSTRTDPDLPGPTMVVSMTATGGSRVTRFSTEGTIQQVAVSPDGTDLYVGLHPEATAPWGIYRVTGPTTAVAVAGTQGLGWGEFVVDDAGVIHAPDVLGDVVYRVAPSGVRTVVAGTGTAGFSGDGGPATAAQLDAPSGVDVAPNGELLIADAGNRRVRSVRVGDGHIFTVAGGGATAGTPGFGGPSAGSVQLVDPRSVAADGAGGFWVADNGSGLVHHVD